MIPELSQGANLQRQSGIRPYAGTDCVQSICPVAVEGSGTCVASAPKRSVMASKGIGNAVVWMQEKKN